MPNEIVNPPTHQHRLTNVGGQQVCMDCSQVIITPILSNEDFAARNPAPAEDTTWAEWLRNNWRGMQPIDFALIDMSESRNVEWPDYIDKLRIAYDGLNPPHVETGVK